LSETFKGEGIFAESNPKSVLVANMKLEGSTLFVVSGLNTLHSRYPPPKWPTLCRVGR